MSSVVRLEEYSDYLAVGTELLNGQFKIEKFLNHGGFGITYLARNSLDKLVVLKECYPNTICRRSKSAVSVRNKKHQSDFDHAKNIFVREAMSLSKLEHPNIVRVHQVFEENETAYMALDYVDGMDLQEIIENDPDRLTPDFVTKILTQLLGAIDAVHNEDILHRDISPDNILIDADGDPTLIDFGAAQDDIAKKSRVLSTLNVIKEGYSPQEFYVSGSIQNNSSDLYALAATIYHCISGDMPPNAQSRLAALAEGRESPYKPLAGNHKGYSEYFLKAIDKTLEIIPKNRIQEAKEWLVAVDPDMDDKLRSAMINAGDDAQSGTSDDTKKKIAIAAAALVALGIGGFVAMTQLGGSPETSDVSAPAITDAATTESATAEDIKEVEKQPVVTPVLTKPVETPKEVAPKVEVATPIITEAPIEKEAPTIAEPTVDVVAVAPKPEAPKPAPTQSVEAKNISDVLALIDSGEADVMSGLENATDTADDTPIVRDFVFEKPEGAPDVMNGLENASDRDEFVAPDDAINSTVTSVDAEQIIDQTESEPVQVPVFELISPTPETPAQPVETQTQEVVAALDTPIEAEISNQIAPTVNTEWKVDLPFFLVDVELANGSGSFPMIAGVKDTADLGFSGDWIERGVTIYSVNNVLVPPAARVDAFLMGMFESSLPNPVTAKVRIRRSPTSEVEEVDLQLGFAQPNQ